MRTTTTRTARPLTRRQRRERLQARCGATMIGGVLVAAIAFGVVGFAATPAGVMIAGGMGAIGAAVAVLAFMVNADA